MGAAPMQDVKDMDFSDEVVFWEGKPATGDLAVNVALGATLLWLVKDVISIGRGVGLWGDMVITLQNGEKLELRSLE
eukprot:gene19457-23265_t